LNFCSENLTVYDLAKRGGAALGARVEYATGDGDRRDYHMDNARALYNLEIREGELKTTHNPDNLWRVEKCLRAYGDYLPTRTDLYKKLLGE
jgi:hypothetical protein